MQMVKVRSGEGHIIEVHKFVAMESGFIKDMLKDARSDAIIPLPKFSRETLSRVFHYCKYHVKQKQSLEKQELWDAEFVKVEVAVLASLATAAHHLHIPRLLLLVTKELVKKHPAELQEIFKPKEEEEVR